MVSSYLGLLNLEAMGHNLVIAQMMSCSLSGSRVVNASEKHLQGIHLLLMLSMLMPLKTSNQVCRRCVHILEIEKLVKANSLLGCPQRSNRLSWRHHSTNILLDALARRLPLLAIQQNLLETVESRSCQALLVLLRIGVYLLVVLRHHQELMQEIPTIGSCLSSCSGYWTHLTTLIMIDLLALLRIDSLVTKLCWVHQRLLQLLLFVKLTVHPDKLTIRRVNTFVR